LNPKLHKLVCKVTKQVPVQDSMLSETKTYDVAFVGQRAELAAQVLKEGTKVNLTGHFYCTSFINDDGRHTGRVTLMVHKLSLPKPVCVEYEPFDYQMATVGKFGGARIWTRARGFTKVPISKLH